MKEKNVIVDNKIFELKLGQNAIENDFILSKAKQNNWWFHLDSFPSGHCIIFSEEINNEVINIAANMVKDNSKYKNLKNLKIIYLQVKNIKKTNEPGKVILKKNGNYINV